MYNVYRGSDEDGWNLVGANVTLEEATKLVLKLVGSRPYLYFRHWTDENGAEFTDYGSWSDFFKFEPMRGGRRE